jgi:hypothetical protein
MSKNNSFYFNGLHPKLNFGDAGCDRSPALHRHDGPDPRWPSP